MENSALPFLCIDRSLPKDDTIVFLILLSSRGPTEVTLSSFRMSASSVGCRTRGECELEGLTALMAGKASPVFGRRPV